MRIENAFLALLVWKWEEKAPDKIGGFKFSNYLPSGLVFWDLVSFHRANEVVESRSDYK